MSEPELSDREIAERIRALEAADGGGRDFDVLNSQLAESERRTRPAAPTGSGPRDYAMPPEDDEDDDGPLHPYRSQMLRAVSIVAIIALGVATLGTTLAILFG
ncbi:hypothetical protein [Agromyces seonyuensis]|uniref:DUF3040 domain-containing protein n=1 Tax=Agromyces seonyuensis TaxID=2662446 RepID=A0A6I4NVV4_9MICO|nr:hypothetical protein [Agromyces seonyuensis]MWB98231.1 hypothetical protein [Agromyces seonyuensis]